MPGRNVTETMVGVKRGPGLEIKLILCPFDFSEFSIRAYQHARSLAEHYRAKLVALDVVELFQHSYLGFRRLCAAI